MGVVYKVLDIELLNRPVAIKVIRSEFRSTPEVVSRLHKDAQVIASLTHPNTIKLWDSSKQKIEA